MKKVTKALFPVAGMGTRLLPATKAVPKELLPVYDTPILELLVEECVSAGIEEIIIVTSREKPAIAQHFDQFPFLEQILDQKNKTAIKDKVTRFKDIKFSFVSQGEAKGDGHAILCAEHLFDEDEPFLVIFGDELHFGNPSSVHQLLESFDENQKSVIGVRKVPIKNISAYGVVNPVSEVNSDTFEISGVVEKPAPEDAPSPYAVIGKYICTGDIWDALKSGGKSEGGEQRLADGLDQLLKNNKAFARTIHGERFDTGNKDGLLMANIFYACSQNDLLKAEIREMLK